MHQSRCATVYKYATVSIVSTTNMQWHSNVVAMYAMYHTRCFKNLDNVNRIAQSRNCIYMHFNIILSVHKHWEQLNSTDLFPLLPFKFVSSVKFSQVNVTQTNCVNHILRRLLPDLRLYLLERSELLSSKPVLFPLRFLVLLLLAIDVFGPILFVLDAISLLLLLLFNETLLFWAFIPLPFGY